MIKLIVGTKGSGKTKAMIDMINDSVKTSKGNVVVVEKGMKLTYEVPNAARLIDLDETGGVGDLIGPQRRPSHRPGRVQDRRRRDAVRLRGRPAGKQL